MVDLLKSLEKQAGSGRVAFLACKEQVVAALGKGYTAKDIWCALRDADAMPLGYEGFMRHMRKLPEYQAVRAVGRQKKGGAEALPAEPAGGKPKRVRARQKANFSLRPDPGNVENLMRTSE